MRISVRVIFVSLIPAGMENRRKLGKETKELAKKISDYFTYHSGRQSIAKSDFVVTNLLTNN